MEDARGEANVLLELLLDPSAPGALLKDHLLVDLILSEGVGGNQVGSGREGPGLSLPNHWLQFLLSALEALDTSRAPLPQGCSRTTLGGGGGPPTCVASPQGLDGPSAPC